MEFYDVLKKRKSIRKYRPNPVSDDALNRILEAGRIAPSAKNIQPWHFIVVRDQSTKESLIDACRGQRFIAEADVVLCGCASEKIAWGHMGGYMSAFAIDLTIAFEHMILAAANEGLATCWIGAFEEKKVKEILQVPDDVRVVALTPIGYAAEGAKERGRKPLEEIVSYEKY
jgi:nitroreductase